MLSTVTYADKATSKKAAGFLRSQAALWKNDTRMIAALRFAGILAFNLQLIIIAELVSSLVLGKTVAADNYRLILLLGLCAIAKAAFCYLGDLKAAEVAEKITVNIRSAIMNDIHKGYISRFRNQYSAGMSLSLLNKTEVIAPYFTRYIPQTILCVMAPATVLIYLTTVNWVCALLILLCAPAVPVFMMVIRRYTLIEGKCPLLRGGKTLNFKRPYCKIKEFQADPHLSKKLPFPECSLKRPHGNGSSAGGIKILDFRQNLSIGF